MQYLTTSTREPDRARHDTTRAALEDISCFRSSALEEASSRWHTQLRTHARTKRIRSSGWTPMISRCDRMIIRFCDGLECEIGPIHLLDTSGLASARNAKRRQFLRKCDTLQRECARRRNTYKNIVDYNLGSARHQVIHESGNNHGPGAVGFVWVRVVAICDQY